MVYLRRLGYGKLRREKSWDRKLLNIYSHTCDIKFWLWFLNCTQPLSTKQKLSKPHPLLLWIRISRNLNTKTYISTANNSKQHTKKREEIYVNQIINTSSWCCLMFMSTIDTEWPPSSCDTHTKTHIQFNCKFFIKKNRCRKQYSE